MNNIRHSKGYSQTQRFFLFLLAVAAAFLPVLRHAQAEDGAEAPAWLKRTEFSLQVESDQKPRIFLQTVQPLYQDADKVNTFFIQPRASVQSENGTYNLGLGYRRLSSENLILGTNFFFDFEGQHRHGRVGVGAEALGQVFEARVNSYFGNITNKVEVGTAGSGVLIERVAQGGDLELGMPVPYMPWLKMYGSGAWYDHDRSPDRFGWKSRLEARLNDHVRFEFYTWDDNKGDTEYGGRFRFNIAFGNPFEVTDALKLSDEPFPKKDLSEELLIPVEREFDITVERYLDQGGLVVEAGRS